MAKGLLAFSVATLMAAVAVFGSQDRIAIQVASDTTIDSSFLTEDLFY